MIWDFLYEVFKGLLTSLVGISVYMLYLTRKYDIKRKLPYRYVCQIPGCYFKFSSTHMESVDEQATEHERHHQDV